MPRDYLGNDISGGDAATLPVIDDFIEGFLGYETRAERIIAAADADQGSCLANAYAGLLWMLLEAPQAPANALRFLVTAERLVAAVSERERLIVAILRAWVSDDVGASLGLCRRLTDQYPRDLAVVKLQQYFEFNRGDAPAMLRVALQARRAAPEVPYAHGLAAFAFEQCHLLDAAEDAARQALSMRRKEPWAQHALAHVALTRGQIDVGAAFLEEVSPTWTDLNSFMLTHIWWHLALFYLSQGRGAQALSIYDAHCWGVAKDYSQDQIGAVSLLARMELAGIDVGSRWQDVADHLLPRVHDTVQPFLTLQYLYGLARAGRREADELLQFVRDFAARAPAFSREVWCEVALPACEGVFAHARGDHATAWSKLSRSLPRMAEVGGSHAQRDLFELLLLDAAVKGGRLVAAQLQLELRRNQDPDGVVVNTALASVYGKLGLEALASEASQRAAATRQRHERH